MLYVSVCLSVGSSLVAASPWLIVGSSLRAASTTIITIIIITTTWVGKPFRTVDSPGILDHLQLEAPSKLNKLLVFLCNGLNLK